MSGEPVKVALLGCGRVAGHHARSIGQADGVSLAAVCDLDERKAEALGAEHGVPHFTNFRAMLGSVPDAAVVSVLTPSGLHFEHAMEVLERFGRHVVVEKPTFLVPDQVQQAFALAESRGLLVFPIFQNRHNPAVRRVRQALQSGELGAVRVVAVRVRWCRTQEYYDADPWRGTFALDGGAVANQGVHHVDLMQYLGGPVTRVSAAARTAGVSIEVEDTAVATLEFASGALGSLEVTTAARPVDVEASVSLVCERGLAQIGGVAVNELQIFTPDPAACAAASEDVGGDLYGRGHFTIYRDVAAALRDGVPFPIGRDDALRTLQLLHGIYRAAETNSAVAVGPATVSERLGRPDRALAARYRTPEYEERGAPQAAKPLALEGAATRDPRHPTAEVSA